MTWLNGKNFKKELMKPGSIVDLNWSPQSGKEMAEQHQGVVLSCESFNSIKMYVVAPISSTERPNLKNLRIQAISDTNKKLYGFICMDQIRTVDPETRKLTDTGHKITKKCLYDCQFVLKKIFSLD